MATTIKARGEIALPKHVRTALRLAPGDRVEFELNGDGEVVLRKAPPADPSTTLPRGERLRARHEAQVRRRAQELLALLRGLD